jgi:hypothetical protein
MSLVCQLGAIACCAVVPYAKLDCRDLSSAGRWTSRLSIRQGHERCMASLLVLVVNFPSLLVAAPATNHGIHCILIIGVMDKFLAPSKQNYFRKDGGYHTWGLILNAWEAFCPNWLRGR